MFRIISRFFLVLLVFGFISTATAQIGQINASSISGKYRVAGTNPDGSSYGGSVTITQSNGEYLFTWTVAGQTFTGTGTLDGTTLTVDWGQNDPVIYEVKNGGRLLEGTWAGGSATETLRK
ncbi:MULTISPECIES: LIC10280 family protein [Leptospira]|uniref:Fibronectin-binding protein n=1 Tax=Leptospira yasudae TaxID=2202201 RepID=A0ABX9M5Z3_9LEPT|nr:MULTISPECIES: fibronectin-binding protein [Leptospira]MBW0432826.1 fibronectin-binding protein [Leptospira yasudae]MCG6169427.1 fibronectin-binding protein [Leptospira sanjuanensis]MCG6194828.1 fibronectin-binding protein [Leptospira sanjuanensis]RHX81324.1 fibronectin-binding protein [Leptospira yasudae]TGK29951.1 fibronectin-binding protein [Leptospira yasudae]